MSVPSVVASGKVPVSFWERAGLRAALWLGLAAFAVVVAAPGCSADPDPTACTPGASVACTGPGGCSGAQVCNAAGDAYSACDCGGGQQNDGGLEPDAGHDPDGGTQDCDLIAQTGCASGERCAWTWTNDTQTQGFPACHPEGTEQEGDACALDPVTLTDNCAGGTTCLSNKCLRNCNAEAEPSGCDGATACVSFAGFDTGFCVLTCDPLTQERSDGAPACGSANPAMPNLGCYGSPAGDFSCVPAFGTSTHGESVGPPVYLNSCAPGHLPLLPDPANNDKALCVALCRPAETHSGDTANAAGQSPSACSDLGAPGAECRYWHALENPDDRSPYSNTLGYCFDYQDFLWDHDMDETTPQVPMPSCTTLPNTDTDGDGVPEHVAWGCGPLP